MRIRAVTYTGAAGTQGIQAIASTLHWSRPKLPQRDIRLVNEIILGYKCHHLQWTTRHCISLPFSLQIKTLLDPGKRVRPQPGCRGCAASEPLLRLFDSQITWVQAGHVHSDLQDWAGLGLL